MVKDKALEELFLAQKPHFTDSNAFMAALTKRLDAVAYVMQHVQTDLLLWLAENSRLIATTLLSLLMTLGIISIISNVQDILQMRIRLEAM